MSKSDATETALLSYIFTATAPAWAAATELDIHLHTADPGESGVSTTSEATYTSYALVTVNRSTADWTVTGDTATNDNLIQFPQCTGGSNTITHESASWPPHCPGRQPLSPILVSSSTPATPTSSYSSCSKSFESHPWRPND